MQWNSAECDEGGTVYVCGEQVRYTLRSLDTRSVRQKELDARRGRPEGNIITVVPGHGQGIHGPRKLLETAAMLSRSKIAWCVDPVPAKGGDPTEGQAIARIVREKMATSFSSTVWPGPTATLVGWSHGASEALLAADHAPDLFPQFLGLCPLGLTDRQPSELVFSFAGEARRILWASLRQQDWTCLKDALRLGSNACIGLLRDLVRTNSVKRLTEDIGWACSRVTGRSLAYPGDVVLLFGKQDTAVRWQDIFPDCAGQEQIASSLVAYRQREFPGARSVEVRLLAGYHVAPEVNAVAFVETGLGLLGQLSGNGAWKAG